MKPAGSISVQLAPLTGGVLPDILFDGMLNPEKQNGTAPSPSMPLRIRNNGEATFANVNISELSTENVTSGK